MILCSFGIITAFAQESVTDTTHSLSQSIPNSFNVIDYPNATHSVANGINNAGQIVGEYDYSSAYPPHGFLLSSGTYTSVDYPRSTGTAAIGINNAGQIVGEYDDSSGHYHGFLLSSGTYTSIDYPNIANTVANEINNAGQIVGYYFDNSVYTHSFLLSSVETKQTTPEFGSVAPIILGISILSIIILSVRTRLLHST